MKAVDLTFALCVLFAALGFFGVPYSGALAAGLSVVGLAQLPAA